MKQWVFIGIGIILGIALVFGLWVLNDLNYRYQGVLIDPPAVAPDFTLTDQHGQTFRLSEQRGKAVLIFFGYTNCPDVCPVTLSEYKKIKAGLGNRAQDVVFVFITVDPERDTPERMALYLGSFDPDFIGLTGELQELETVWKNYGVYRQRQDVGSAAGYLMDHSSRLYTIDSRGQWRINYPFGFEASRIVQDLLHLLREPAL